MGGVECGDLFENAEICGFRDYGFNVGIVGRREVGEIGRSHGNDFVAINIGNKRLYSRLCVSVFIVSLFAFVLLDF